MKKTSWSSIILKNDSLYRKDAYWNDNMSTQTHYDSSDNISDVFYSLNGKTTKQEHFFESGQLSTLFLYEKAKIVSVEQFDTNGYKIEDVFIDKKGNERWLKCAEDGSYCCDCIIRRGK